LSFFNLKIWEHVTNVGGTFSQDTIFELPARRLGGRTRFLRNYISTVTIPTTDFSFPNPKKFMPLAGELWKNRDWSPEGWFKYKAEQEVEALLDHLFEHRSTAPFIAKHLIQRMVTSNPCPRYIESVANAFATGQHDGLVFSGRYGDMGAAVHAVLTDPSARSPLVEADPGHGRLREPFLKIVGLLRALQFETYQGQEVILRDMDEVSFFIFIIISINYLFHASALYRRLSRSLECLDSTLPRFVRRALLVTTA
jgi:hypothetical protein